MFHTYFVTKHWNVSLILNGSLAGLVAITAGCSTVTPTIAVIIGALAGVVLVIAIGVVESLKIDDEVGAFAVHGACGAFGTLMIGIVGSSALLEACGWTHTASPLDGGSLDLFGA